MSGGRWTTVSVSRLEIGRLNHQGFVKTGANISVDEAAVLRNNAHMPQNDAAFCVWILAQLHNKDYDMVEPFFILGSGLLDIRTLYQRLENGGFGNAAEFQTALVSIPTSYLERYSTYQSRVHTQATNLLLELPERFAQRNRWEGNRRRHSHQHHQQQQQQQAPIVPSTSASAAAVQVPPPIAPADPAAPIHDAASIAAPDAHQQSRFSSPFAFRTSATPGPPGRLITSPGQGATGSLASNRRVSEHPARADSDDIPHRVSEAVDHESALREARRGKKRASSDQGVGSCSKKPRQEVEKHKYR